MQASGRNPQPAGRVVELTYCPQMYLFIVFFGFMAIVVKLRNAPKKKRFAPVKTHNVEFMNPQMVEFQFERLFNKRMSNEFLK